MCGPERRGMGERGAVRGGQSTSQSHGTTRSHLQDAELTRNWKKPPPLKSTPPQYRDGSPLGGGGAVTK